MKTCTDCKRRKSEDAFYRYPTGRLTGRCKQCTLQIRTDYRRSHSIPPRTRAFDDQTRTCTHCRTTKPLTDYYDNGMAAKCKECTKALKIERARKAGVKPRRPRDPIVAAIANNLRTRIWHALRGVKKSQRTRRILGCTFEEFKLHLERHFEPGMSWANHGFHGWHIGHVVDCCAFDLKDETQQKLCFHYTNMKPQWAADNWRKPRMYNERGVP